MKELQSRLLAVQGSLKAPKGQYNSFGKYKYRSCEDILEAVKPLLVDNGLLLTIEDDIVAVGDRIYIKATVTVSYEGQSISKSAFAREELEKKGMDASQVTGAASSYARKYALNGLFCIDDTKDSDATNNGGKNIEPENPLMDVALSDAINAESESALKAVWENYSSLQGNKAFRNIINKRKAELNGTA